jgi:hypothetical protein
MQKTVARKIYRNHIKFALISPIWSRTNRDGYTHDVAIILKPFGDKLLQMIHAASRFLYGPRFPGCA